MRSTRVLIALAVAILGLSGAPRLALAGDPASPVTLTAVYAGHPIPLADVSAHFCTDAAYPTIRCFDSQAAVNADLAAATTAAIGPAPDGTLSITYCIWYQDANYGSNAFSQTIDEPSLALLGWNDKISSLKQPNGHQCIWYSDANYAGTAWYWAAGTSVPSLGAANDVFSSVWIIQ